VGRSARLVVALVAVLVVAAVACSESNTTRVEDPTSTTGPGPGASSTTTTSGAGGTSSTEATQPTVPPVDYADVLGDLQSAEDYCAAALIMEEVYGRAGDLANMSAAQLEQFLVFLGEAITTVGRKAPEEIKQQYDTITSVWPEVLAEAEAVGYDPAILLEEDFGEAINTELAKAANDVITEYNQTNCEEEPTDQP